MKKFEPKEKAKRFWARYNSEQHFFVEVDSKLGPDWVTLCGLSMSIRPLEIRAQRKCQTCIEKQQQTEAA